GHGARAARNAPAAAAVLLLPCRHRPDRLRARGFRRHRQGAPHRPLRAHRDRHARQAARRHRGAQSRRAAPGAAGRSGAIRAERHRAADDLCPGAPGGGARHAAGARHRAPLGRRQLSVQGTDHEHRAQRRVPEGEGAGCPRGPAGQPAGRGGKLKRREAMYITKKALSRRTVLQGAGAALALPLLDAMIPAGTALASTAAKPAPRLGFVYFPHGAIIDAWSPKQTGTDFEMSPILKPLEHYRDYLTVVSGLRNKGGESSDPHGIMAGTWLSCHGVANREGDRGTTADQLAARHFT